MNSFKQIIFKTFLTILRILPPEISSSLSLNSIKFITGLNSNFLMAMPKKRLEKIKIAKLEFEHYLGLSAGIDKSGEYFH